MFLYLHIKIKIMKKLFLSLCLLIITGAPFYSFAQICKPVFNYSVGSGGNVTFNLTYPTIGPGTGISCRFLFGDGSNVFASGAVTNHTYLYNYPLYKVDVQIFDTLNVCYDTSYQYLAITNATPVNCQGTASFSYAPSGSQTKFTNTNSFAHWRIIDFGDGIPNQSAGSIGPDVYYQYKLNGTYNATAVSFQQYGNITHPCDTFTTSVTVNNVPCSLQMSVEADTMFYYYIHGSSVYSTGYTNFKWYIDGVLFSTANYFNTPFNFPEGTYIISLAATGPNGCQDSLSDTIDLYYTLPCVGATADVYNIGNYDDYQFTSSGSGVLASSWAIDNVVVSTNPTLVQSIPFPVGQNSPYHIITCSLTGNNCMDNYIFYVVNPAGFYFELDTSSSMNTWYVYLTGNLQIASQFWDFGDGFTSTLAAPSHIYSTGGYYNLCHTITTTSGCTYDYCYNNYFYKTGLNSNPFQVIVMPSTTGVSENDFSDIKIFPNPVENTLQVHGKIEPFSEVKIINMAGQSVKSMPYSPSISTDDIVPGIYILDIQPKIDSHLRLRFIKQ